MPANPMGRGLPMSTMVLPDEAAPEASPEAGAAFLAVLEAKGPAGVAARGAIAAPEAVVAPTEAPALPIVGATPGLRGGSDRLSPPADGQGVALAGLPGGSDRLSPPADGQGVAPSVREAGSDKLSRPADGQAPASSVRPGGPDTLSPPAGGQGVAPAPAGPAPGRAPTPPAPAPARANTSAPTALSTEAARGAAPRLPSSPDPRPAPRPRRDAPRPIAATQAPTLDLAQAPTPTESVESPDVATHVARATEAADASSASSVRAHGLRHVRLAIPTDDGAIRARVTVDQHDHTVDVAIRGTDDVGLSAARRVSELREGLAQHGLRLDTFDARAVGAEQAADPTGSESGDRHARGGAFTDADGERGPSRGPRDTGDPQDTASHDRSTRNTPSPRAASRWDDDAPVGQLLDLRI